MSLQSPRFTSQWDQNSEEGPVTPSHDNLDTTKTSSRIRTACDSCHRAKIKCSGGVPCVACQTSLLSCTYSHVRRLGRPKGSKNKRTPVQASNKTRQDLQETNNSTSLDGVENSLEPQNQADPMNIEYGFDDDFNSFLEDDLTSSQEAILNDPVFASFFDSLCGNHKLKSPEAHIDAHSVQSTATLANPLQFHMPGIHKDGSGVGRLDSGTVPMIDSNFTGLDESNLFGSESSLASNSPVMTTNRCSCLQQHVQLVYQLADLQYSQMDSPSVDSALRGVQLAQGPWRSLMQCTWCRNQDHQKEVFLLFSLSIRILLSAVQRLHVDVKNWSGQSSSIVSDPLTGLDIKVSVGSFEVTGKTKAEVISMAIKNALRSIKCALLHLRDHNSAGISLPNSKAYGNANTAANSHSRKGGAPGSPISIIARTPTESPQILSRPNMLASTEATGDDDVEALFNKLHYIMCRTPPTP